MLTSVKRRDFDQGTHTSMKERLRWRWAVLQAGGKDTAGSGRAKHVQQSTGKLVGIL